MMNSQLDHDQILDWLREEDPARLEELWAAADRVRQMRVGDAVHLRGLIEISNHCARECAYCGLRRQNVDLQRYRMSREEILEAAHRAEKLGFGTVVMQAGEDYGIRGAWLGEIVREIKSQTKLAVTLSMGERSEADLMMWREAGADRYLLRFETSDRELFERIHPARAGQACDRIAMLRKLKAMGYEVGSGIMAGIPGQNYESVARDIELFRELDLDMIGVGPFIAHPGTPLGRGDSSTQSSVLSPQSFSSQSPHPRPLPRERELEQVPNTEGMVYKTVSLARLVCPEANIPSTTALATINKVNGRELGLQRGANVVMPNVTPVKYRALYEIYPAKACVGETGEQCNGCLRGRIRSIGRTVGVGAGGRR